MEEITGRWLDFVDREQEQWIHFETFWDTGWVGHGGAGERESWVEREGGRMAQKGGWVKEEADNYYLFSWFYKSHGAREEVECTIKAENGTGRNHGFWSSWFYILRLIISSGYSCESWTSSHPFPSNTLASPVPNQFYQFHTNSDNNKSLLINYVHTTRCWLVWTERFASSTKTIHCDESRAKKLLEEREREYGTW